MHNARATRMAIMSDARNTNLWGGRFTGETDCGFADYNRSFGFDRRLFAVDVRASIAHCDGLAGAGVLTGAESNEIKSALQAILDRGQTDASYFDEPNSEDVQAETIRSRRTCACGCATK
ncbi:MAG: hypothetical protein DMF70_02720 [Acidobacteria bacterium]|nr:MAG: hypothetical protein DMF70_02720 [Acidobacteriota bacterium]